MSFKRSIHEKLQQKDQFNLQTFKRYLILSYLISKMHDTCFKNDLIKENTGGKLFKK